MKPRCDADGECLEIERARASERARTLAEVCAWLRGAMGSTGQTWIDREEIADAIERGDYRPRGEGGEKP